MTAKEVTNLQIDKRDKATWLIATFSDGTQKAVEWQFPIDSKWLATGLQVFASDLMQ